jgi:hypothetical protein
MINVSGSIAGECLSTNRTFPALFCNQPISVFDCHPVRFEEIARSRCCSKALKIFLSPPLCIETILLPIFLNRAPLTHICGSLRALLRRFGIFAL